MKKIKAIITILVILIGANIALAWEARIDIKAGNTETGINIGQRVDATDGIDGLYDVPALLSGNLQAYIKAGDEKLWRDIRREGSDSVWELVIESLIDGDVIIKWDIDRLPSEKRVELIDGLLRIDMKAVDSYIYRNEGVKTLRIEVRR
jgi:hypothetical protein